MSTSPNGGTPTQIVILIHGIRTQAEWAEMVREVLERSGPDGITKVIPLRYGYFDAVRFWFPFWTRTKRIEELEWKLRDAIANNPSTENLVIAHSFGTYALTKILERRPDLDIDRAIFCGSIVPQNYRWDKLPRRPDIVNECGGRDIWPVLATSATWGFGASGTYGFGTSGVFDRHHDMPHSGYFDKDFVERFWKPWIHQKLRVKSAYDLDRPTAPWWRSMLGILPLRWVLVLMLVALVALAVFCSIPSPSGTEVVNTNDRGAGSLRQAILNANASIGANTVSFNIPGRGPHTISPASALPDIADRVTIDGTTQKGFLSSPVILLDGAAAGVDANGLRFVKGSANSTVKGLKITGFDGSAIFADVVDSLTIQGNVLGDETAPNKQAGVHLRGSDHNMIGGTAEAERNVISGNRRYGVWVGTGSDDNVVLGNYIGTNVSGDAALDIQQVGIDVLGRRNTIGGTYENASNVISGNMFCGVRLRSINLAVATDNKILGNRIGVNFAAEAAVANGREGIQVAGSAKDNVIGAIDAGNVISGNKTYGVLVDGQSTGTVIEANWIGTDRAGTRDLGNGRVGIDLRTPGNMVGGTAPDRRNVIAFHGLAGVRVLENFSTRNRISGNSMFEGRGIYLSEGIMLNDADDPDAGPNNLQNHPLLTSATFDGGNLTIAYSVPSIPPNSTFPLQVEFFLADRDTRQGKTFLGGDHYPDPGADTVVVAAGDAVTGDRIVATATDADGNTSEFSAPVKVAAETDP